MEHEGEKAYCVFGDPAWSGRFILVIDPAGNGNRPESDRSSAPDAAPMGVSGSVDSSVSDDGDSQFFGVAQSGGGAYSGRPLGVIRIAAGGWPAVDRDIFLWTAVCFGVFLAGSLLAAGLFHSAVLCKTQPDSRVADGAVSAVADLCRVSEFCRVADELKIERLIQKQVRTVLWFG